jgi:hypothetical protein
MRPQNRPVPGRTSPRCRSDVRGDGISSSPTGGIARAERDRADTDVTVLDLPGLLRASGLRRRVRADMPP